MIRRVSDVSGSGARVGSMSRKRLNRDRCEEIGRNGGWQNGFVVELVRWLSFVGKN